MGRRRYNWGVLGKARAANLVRFGFSKSKSAFFNQVFLLWLLRAGRGWGGRLPQCSRIVGGRRGYNSGALGKARAANPVGCEFLKSKSAYLTEFFCYGSMGRAGGGEGGDANAPQLFGEGVGTIGERWRRLQQLTCSSGDF